MLHITCDYSPTPRVKISQISFTKSVRLIKSLLRGILKKFNIVHPIDENQFPLFIVHKTKSFKQIHKHKI